MSTGNISIRERHGILSLGELATKITAKQGFSHCPATTEIVSVLRTVFQAYVASNKDQLQLYKPETGLNFGATIYLVDWQSALINLGLRSYKVNVHRDSVEIDVEFTHPVNRSQRGAPDPTDNRVKFELTWEATRELTQAHTATRWDGRHALAERRR